MKLPNSSAFVSTAAARQECDLEDTASNTIHTICALRPEWSFVWVLRQLAGCNPLKRSPVPLTGRTL